jgi:hypothetical protein
MKHGIQMGRRSAFLIHHLSLWLFLVLGLPAKVASPDLSKHDQAIISFNLTLSRYQTDSKKKKTCRVWNLEPGAQ